MIMVLLWELESDTLSFGRRDAFSSKKPISGSTLFNTIESFCGWNWDLIVEEKSEAKPERDRPSNEGFSANHSHVLSNLPQNVSLY